MIQLLNLQASTLKGTGRRLREEIQLWLLPIHLASKRLCARVEGIPGKPPLVALLSLSLAGSLGGHS